MEYWVPPLILIVVYVISTGIILYRVNRIHRLLKNINARPESKR